MHDGSSIPPSAAAFLQALAQRQSAVSSGAGAFIKTHRTLILAGLNAGYSVAQILRGLKALGLSPPMSERQFYRHVKALQQRPALSVPAAPVTPRTAPTPAIPAGRAMVTGPERPSAARPDGTRPRTFDWAPETDLDDLR
ncbi:hypothetical protein [Allochromatium vinosum]|uniref:hypothetical protein n=1 Tax=Allochromatium vinosum TaxID=1049 RepID=UPI001905392E|nr:hypothetical protein [Allochromatium vinosum]